MFPRLLADRPNVYSKHAPVNETLIELGAHAATMESKRRMSQESCKDVLDTLRQVRVISHMNAAFHFDMAFPKRDAAYFYRRREASSTRRSHPLVYGIGPQ
jgi:hypothetical protein